VAEDLAPSVTVELDRSLLVGIALEGGSRTSHAAILARALGIPAVVGVPGVMRRAAGVREMAIDGGSGTVILEPDGEAREQLATAVARHEADRAADDALRTRPLVTSDGHRVICAANVGAPDEVERAVAAGAEAVGLFRTEFAFAGRTAPGEDDQADAYERALRAADGAHMVFRLADIGGDKPLPYVDIGPEANPFLGVRGIRLAGRHPDLFVTQLRAILRASAATGSVAAIMAPMVADEADLMLYRTLVEQAQAAVPDAPAPEVGIMVEVPAAVSLADRLAAQVDFMSIGTNDLTQYLLAADRSNPALGHRQDPLHPAVLRAVRQVVEAAASTECRVAVCGEMAGDPAGAMLLVGLGVGELSMGPEAFGPVKRAVASHSRAALEALATEALALGSAAEVRAKVAAA
jgi:phosphoenolpyruvate-protein phosphotransferase